MWQIFDIGDATYFLIWPSGERIGYQTGCQIDRGCFMKEEKGRKTMRVIITTSPLLAYALLIARFLLSGTQPSPGKGT